MRQVETSRALVFDAPRYARLFFEAIGSARAPSSRAQHSREPACPDGRTTRRPNSANQASYDLARLRLNGLLTRVPGRNQYTLNPNDQQFAVFYTKVHDRVLRPLVASRDSRDQPHTPSAFRAALRTIDQAVDRRLARPPARSGLNKTHPPHKIRETTTIAKP